MSDTITQYLCYKRATKVALAWVWGTAENTNTSPAFKTTSEIIAAAQKICSGQQRVPSYVISALRDAVKHRWRVFNAFALAKDGSKAQEMKDRDERHKAFIMRLQKTLDLLLPLEEKEAANPISINVDPDYSSINAASNRFQALSVLESEPMERINSDHNQPEVISRPTGPSPPKKMEQPLALENMILEDDEFGEYYLLSYFMNELDTLLITTNTYWIDAAKGKIPLPVAAWLSTTVYHAVARIFMKHEFIVPNYDTLMEKWFKHRQAWQFRIRFKDVPDLTKEEGPCWDGIVLWYHGRLINDCRTSKEYEKIVPTAGGRQDPYTLIPIPLPSDRGVGDYDNAIDKMQESMRLGINGNRGISKIEPAQELKYSCEPLLPELQRTLANKQEPVPLQLVFGYEMLLSSFKTFLWVDGKPNQQNCRLIALNLAIQVKNEIKKAADPMYFNCKCEACVLQSLKLELGFTEARLNHFIGEIRFDLYYQAPWTAGCHMVELLNFAMYEGLNMCLRSGLVCPILHLYNALIHLTPAMPRVKIMDELCLLFQDHFFLGTFPKDNFSSHFRRAMGGKISKTVNEETPYTRITMPEKSPLPSSVKRGFSLFYDVQNNDYGPTIEVWKKVYFGSSRKELTMKEEREFIEQLEAVPFNVPLDKLKDAVMPEFTGPLPVMRLNYFAIHAFCAKLMLTLNGKLLYDGVIHGVDTVDHLLSKIMDHLGDSLKRRLLEHWHPMKVMKQCFADLDNQKSLGDFVWVV